jgi:hypothetical protein
MILKESDGIHRDIDCLEALARHPNADTRIRLGIEEEIRKLKAGERGELGTANQLKVFFGDSQHWLVINDLRLEHRGVVAQIDHLLINRTLDIWICESKHARYGVKINPYGEFMTFDSAGRPRGMDSPIEQNDRHARVLGDILAAGIIQLPRRLGRPLSPRIHTLVLIAQGAIARPRVPVHGIETVIKSEHLHRHVTEADDNGNPFDILKLLDFQKIVAIGRQLVALHRPLAQDWARRVGLDAAPEPPLRAAGKPVRAVATPPETGPGSCRRCSNPVSIATSRYCRQRSEIFGGEVFCPECQAGAAVPAGRRAP